MFFFFRQTIESNKTSFRIQDSSIFQIQNRKMTVAEQPCYTLINTSQDLEPPSEMQLREDLEKGNDKVRLP